MNLNFGTIIYSNFTYPTDIQLDTPPDENLGMRDISQLQHSKTVEYHKVRKFFIKSVQFDPLKYKKSLNS